MEGGGDAEDVHKITHATLTLLTPTASGSRFSGDLTR